MIRTVIILVICSIVCTQSVGQEKEPDYIANRLDLENKLDSLFMKSNYKQLIGLCRETHPGYLQSTCTYNLIGAFYFSGDSVSSYDLLNREITRIQFTPDKDAYSLADLLDKDYASYKKFLITSNAKEYIIRCIDSTYRHEPISDKENGLTLMHLLIEDHWIRNTSSLYDHFLRGRRHLLPSQMDSLQAIQAQRNHSTLVFDFYKAQGKVFSKTEVGRIYYWQLLLFFHEWDLKRRSFYHELVVQGVKDGSLTLENQMIFEVGTEFIKMGVKEFFLHKDEIQERFREKYSRPDFRVRIL